MEQRFDNESLLGSGQYLVGEQKIVIGGAEDDPETLNEFDNAVADGGRRGKRREIALVYDRYYEKAPKTFLLLAGKVLFCCALCLCSMMFLFENLDMPIDMTAAGIMCVGFTAAFSVTFMFVHKAIVVPVTMLAASVIVWHNRDAFWEKLSLFIDAMKLQLDGRLMQTRESVTHTELFADNGTDLIDPGLGGELMFGVAALCLLFSLIVSTSMFRRPHFMTILAPFLAMWAPRMIAERLLFNAWLIPTAALYAGAMAMTIVHKDGLAIRHGFTHSYRSVVARNEHLFDLRTENAPYVRKVGLRGAYNAKYFTLGAGAAALFLASLLAANAVLGDSRGIDYTELYDYLKELAGGGGVTSPFRTGPVSEYFSSPGRGEFGRGLGLSITNPGTGEQEIMRVKNGGTLPIYLRGDIGVEFDGKDWSSPITKLPEGWSDYLDNGLAEDLRAQTEAWTYCGAAEEAELVVDCLCDASVMFLPSYITFLGRYRGSDEFEVLGDYAVRATDKAEKLPTLRGNAYTPYFIGIGDNPYDEYSVSGSSFSRTRLEQTVEYLNDEYDWFYLNYGQTGAEPYYYPRYRDYVYESYLQVPESLERGISDYIGEHFAPLAVPLGSGALTERYAAAAYVADYLRDNYVYSLNARINKRDPVTSFLNETKSGHCALYASAMVMIMRELGIPARYCTGFVAPPTDGGSMVLRSKNLHAWVEVYLDRIGWITFDPTSAASVEEALNGGVPDSGSDGSDNSEHPEYPELSDSSDDPDNSDGSESFESSDSSDGADLPISRPDRSDSSPGDVPREPDGSLAADGGGANVLPYLLTVSGIIAGAGLIAFVIYRIRKFDRNAKKALRRFYAAENSQDVYLRLLAALRLRGLAPRPGELSGEFFRRAGVELGYNLSKRRELLERLAFGSGELSDADKARLGRLLEKVFAAADKKLGPIGKVRLRLIMLGKPRRRAEDRL